MIETISTLPISKGGGAISSKQGAEVMLDMYDLDKIQAAVCIYFFYSEFMEKMRTLFQEAQGLSDSQPFNPSGQVQLTQIFTSISNIL